MSARALLAAAIAPTATAMAARPEKTVKVYGEGATAGRTGLAERRPSGIRAVTLHLVGANRAWVLFLTTVTYQNGGAAAFLGPMRAGASCQRG